MTTYNIANAILLLILGYKISIEIEALCISFNPSKYFVETWTNSKNRVDRALRLNRNLHKVTTNINIIKEMLSIGGMTFLLMVINKTFAMNNKYNLIIITTAGLLAITLSFILTIQRYIKGYILIRYYYINTLTLQKHIDQSNDSTTKKFTELINQLARNLNIIIESEQGSEIIDIIENTSDKYWRQHQQEKSDNNKINYKTTIDKINNSNKKD